MLLSRPLIHLCFTLSTLVPYAVIAIPLRDTISPTWGAPLPRNNDSPAHDSIPLPTESALKDERIRWNEDLAAYEKPPPDPRFAPLKALTYSTNSTTPPPTFLDLYGPSKELYRQRSLPFPSVKAAFSHFLEKE
ncbi:hypothetical protein BJ684DRAFT_14965 [Piptocephalis cylindrospora]|uniref:Uncharacterized protein n=1 Tax=Piptocephalis cylindrospora TaxID=1907219 RepID=A0A4P9Y6W7_9FUNG|nr:hypothetical protein BJ684DRAFT_14965 [Piptocephalis cylindrospora]|eukprot:RKP14723.1 hypothetical protein BJ684DRAFT_14965 [Piptocephalis cylindrospora]